MAIIKDNLFPAQGKVVFVTENHISAGLEYARILANAESKFLIANQKSSEDLYKKLWEDKTAFMPKELTPMTYFVENFMLIKQPDGSKRKLSEKQIEEIKWFEKMSKTHTPKLIKMRRGGTKTVWVKKQEKLTNKHYITMKKVLFALSLMFCMSFSVSEGYSKNERPIVEKEKVFSISTNFP